MSILVVDDNADLADMLAEMLALSGYRCEVAYDADHALWLAGRCRFELCFIDILLGDMSGYQLAMHIRELCRRRQVLVPRMIAWSGLQYDADHPDAPAAGFEHYLVKPIEWDTLKFILQPASALTHT